MNPPHDDLPTRIEFPAGVADFVHGIRVPGGREPAEWAREYAAVAPELVPSGWPESARMCLVVVYRGCTDFRPEHNCETAACLVTRPEAMHFLATYAQQLKNPRQLWFRVPRRLFTAELCPDLKPAHWPAGE